MSTRPNVVSFIKKEREAGKNDNSIRRDLLEAGWQIDIIDRALSKTPTKSSPQTGDINHFTQYNEWYTQKHVVYGAIIILVLVVFGAVYA